MTESKVKEGWLMKEGEGLVGGWKRRYFVLTTNSLMFFVNQVSF